ncbi:MAG TPA: chemotaxis protein CheB [Chitinophagaceae bacterium]|jgi:two-component system chemotaxis response regulator CheB|nr:chemotaxis protein CheB [Chitinophagaceae bacterium]
MPDKKPPFIIVIGASAGGLNAIIELVSQLPKELNASVFIVLHLSKAAIGDILVTKIQKNTALTCKIAEDKEQIKTGHIYVAPPDVHLLVKEEQIILGHGPAENRFRPSIDVLFRSAAASHRDRAVGVILTGLLNDGTIGMHAIKSSGGYSIVQDPNEADYPDMSLAVLENMEVDYCISLKNMADVILHIINNAEPRSVSVPANIIEEAKLSEKSATTIEQVSKLGEKTLYSCPDCGGDLWNIENGKLKHYRCHIGHSFSESDLLLKQSEETEHTLWVAVRMMEERKLLLQKMANEHDDRGLQRLNLQYSKRAKELEQHIAKLKELLFSIAKN